MAPIAASATHGKLSAGMVFALPLLTAGHQRLLLLGSDQLFNLLMGLLVDLLHLLVFLLRRERSVGADRLDLGMCFAVKRHQLLHHRSIDTGSLKTGAGVSQMRATHWRRIRIGGWSALRRSALRNNAYATNQQHARTQESLQHG